nr:MAG TPA: hypothetical protein [Microviridae sp.]
MIAKSWNIRDQTTEALKKEVDKCYKMIVKYNRWIARAATVEEAKALIDEKFNYRRKANNIELELMRRRANGEETF